MKKQIHFMSVVASLILAASSCGKKVEIEDGMALLADGGSGGNASCDAGHLRRWNFVQPQPTTTQRSVDLLFVMDTSASLDAERAQIAATLPAFVQQLNPGTDYRIAVMLAHGGASPNTGRLYSYFGLPKVLNSQIHTQAYIKNALTQTFNHPAYDVDEADGEMMLYSLNRSLDADRVAEIQQQGFFRSNAALSVVIITDENDICYLPNLHGYTHFPDYNPAPDEVIAYNRYCVNSNHQEIITPAGVLSKLRAFKGSLPVTLGGIIHQDPARVPVGDKDESISHGILELLQLDLNSMIADVTESDYSTGLGQLGNIVSTELILRTLFNLGNQVRIHPESLKVAVDGSAISALFDEGTSSVQIRTMDAGHAGSNVTVEACLVD